MADKEQLTQQSCPTMEQAMSQGSELPVGGGGGSIHANVARELVCHQKIPALQTRLTQMPAKKAPSDLGSQ